MGQLVCHKSVTIVLQVLINSSRTAHVYFNFDNSPSSVNIAVEQPMFYLNCDNSPSSVKYSLEHRAAHALGHLVYVHISCISRASYALWDSYHALWRKKILYHVTIVTYTNIAVEQAMFCLN